MDEIILNNEPVSSGSPVSKNKNGIADSKSNPIKKANPEVSEPEYKRVSSINDLFTQELNMDLNNRDFLSGREDVLTRDVDDIRGQRQNSAVKLTKGVGRAAGKAVTEILKIPGLVGGLGLAAANELAGGEESSIDLMFNNSWIKALDDAGKAVNDSLEVYSTKEMNEGNLWDHISSSGFWATDGADGVGFILSMLAPGAALKALNIGKNIVGGTAKGYSLLSKAVTGGKGGTSAFGAAKVLSKMGVTSNGVDMAAITLANTYAESAAEAFGAITNFDDQKSEIINSYTKSDIEDLETLYNSNTIDSEEYNRRYDDIMDAANAKFAEQRGQLGSDIFKSNAGILLLPNFIQSKILFGGGFAAKSLAKAKPTLASQAKGGVKALMLGSLSEGFWEEGMQTTVENMFTNSAKKGELDPDKGFLHDFNIQELAREYANTLTTVDGQKAIFLGAFLGGGMNMIGSIKNAENDYKAAMAVLSKASGISDINRAMGDIYKKDPHSGNIIYKDGKPQLDVAAIKKLAESTSNTILLNKLHEAALLENMDGGEALQGVAKLIQDSISSDLAADFALFGENGKSGITEYIEDMRKAILASEETDEIKNAKIEAFNNTEKILLEQYDNAVHNKNAHDAINISKRIDSSKLTGEDANDRMSNFRKSLSETFVKMKGKSDVLERIKNENIEAINKLKKLLKHKEGTPLTSTLEYMTNELNNIQKEIDAIDNEINKSLDLEHLQKMFDEEFLPQMQADQAKNSKLKAISEIAKLVDDAKTIEDLDKVKNKHPEFEEEFKNIVKARRTTLEEELKKAKNTQNAKNKENVKDENKADETFENWDSLSEEDKEALKSNKVTPSKYEELVLEAEAMGFDTVEHINNYIDSLDNEEEVEGVEVEGVETIEEVVEDLSEKEIEDEAKAKDEDTIVLTGEVQSIVDGWNKSKDSENVAKTTLLKIFDLDRHTFEYKPGEREALVAVANEIFEKHGLYHEDVDFNSPDIEISTEVKGNNTADSSVQKLETLKPVIYQVKDGTITLYEKGDIVVGSNVFADDINKDALGNKVRTVSNMITLEQVYNKANLGEVEAEKQKLVPGNIIDIGGEYAIILNHPNASGLTRYLTLGPLPTVGYTSTSTVKNRKGRVVKFYYGKDLFFSIGNFFINAKEGMIVDSKDSSILMLESLRNESKNIIFSTDVLDVEEVEDVEDSSDNIEEEEISNTTPEELKPTQSEKDGEKKPDIKPATETILEKPEDVDDDSISGSNRKENGVVKFEETQDFQNSSSNSNPRIIVPYNAQQAKLLLDWFVSPVNKIGTLIKAKLRPSENYTGSQGEYIHNPDAFKLFHFIKNNKIKPSVEQMEYLVKYLPIILEIPVEGGKKVTVSVDGLRADVEITKDEKPRRGNTKNAQKSIAALPLRFHIIDAMLNGKENEFFPNIVSQSSGIILRNRDNLGRGINSKLSELFMFKGKSEADVLNYIKQNLVLVGGDRMMRNISSRENVGANFKGVGDIYIRIPNMKGEPTNVKVNNGRFKEDELENINNMFGILLHHKINIFTDSLRSAALKMSNDEDYAMLEESLGKYKDLATHLFGKDFKFQELISLVVHMSNNDKTRIRFENGGLSIGSLFKDKISGAQAYLGDRTSITSADFENADFRLMFGMYLQMIKKNIKTKHLNDDKYLKFAIDEGVITTDVVTDEHVFGLPRVEDSARAGSAHSPEAFQPQLGNTLVDAKGNVYVASINAEEFKSIPKHATDQMLFDKSSNNTKSKPVEPKPTVTEDVSPKPTENVEITPTIEPTVEKTTETPIKPSKKNNSKIVEDAQSDLFADIPKSNGIGTTEAPKLNTSDNVVQSKIDTFNKLTDVDQKAEIVMEVMDKMGIEIDTQDLEDFENDSKLNEKFEKVIKDYYKSHNDAKKLDTICGF